ncbi:MAG: hypothetical protein WC942_10125 [Clostridia bacterium]
MKCKICGKELDRRGRNKTGYCRRCYSSLPKTEEANRKNSEALKEAHKKNPEKWKGKKSGFCSREWIKSHPEVSKKSGKTLSKKLREGLLIHYNKGKHLSDKQKINLSLKRIEYLENNPNYGLKWYVVNGIKVQGSWEKKFAEFLTEKNIKWERKRIKYNKIRTYTPDFYCKDFDCYFEVKGFLRDRDLYKMYLVLDENPDLKIKMIRKEQLNDLENINIFELENFQEIYKREDIDESKFVNVWK